MPRRLSGPLKVSYKNCKTIILKLSPRDDLSWSAFEWYLHFSIYWLSIRTICYMYYSARLQVLAELSEARAQCLRAVDDQQTRTALAGVHQSRSSSKSREFLNRSLVSTAHLRYSSARAAASTASRSAGEVSRRIRRVARWKMSIQYLFTSRMLNWSSRSLYT